jgi:hypothetical protein
MHLFWSSHKEKRACVRLSMGGGHGWSWSFHGPSMGSSLERGKEGEREEGEGRGAGGTAWGAREAGAPGWLRVALLVRESRNREKLNVMRKHAGVRRKEKKKKRKEKKKRKNMKKFPNLKIFRKKNKRQFMKLVKIIFVQERNNSNYN